MPAIEASHRRTVIIMIEIMDQLIMSRIVWVAQIWCIIILFHSLTVHLLRKTPGASEIIFRTSSADCRIFVIPVNIEFYFAFSPPVTFQCCQSNISSYIMSFSFYTIQDCIIFLFLCQSLPFPLCMEISDIIRKLTALKTPPLWMHVTNWGCSSL